VGDIEDSNDDNIEDDGDNDDGQMEGLESCHDRAEPGSSALFLLNFVIPLHVPRHKPKEGLAFLVEYIYLYYFQLSYK